MIQADDLKSEDPAQGSTPKLDHQCDWKVAALKLAKCVVATLQTGGKIGVGSGLVMRTRDGKRVVERWDKDFIEALAFIGIEMVEKPKKTPKKTPTTVGEALARESRLRDRPRRQGRASARRAGAPTR